MLFQRHVQAFVQNVLSVFGRILVSVFDLVFHTFHTCCKSIFQWFQLFQSYVAVSVFMLQVASILSGCCICITHMFQVYVTIFHLLQTYVAKIDQDIAYVASISEAFYKRLFKIFQLFSDVYLQVFFIWSLHMFHTCCKSMFQWFQLFQCYVAVSVFMLQVASVLSGCCICITHMF